jgi:pseudouridine-5'-phosphate glycosidase
MTQFFSKFRINPEAQQALQLNKPVVALETTVITHGLPKPINLNLALDMEKIIREHGAFPASIGVLHGEVVIGLREDELEELAGITDLRKISVRDFSAAIAQKDSGGTTVAGTLAMAELAGIQVFATGGIGGVHRGSSFDVSADLQQLGRSPAIVVCAGAKAILDLPATLEYLETMGVVVVGYQTNELPAFYSRSSGLQLSMRADSPSEVAAIAQAHWGLGFKSAILLTVPIPAGDEIPHTTINTHIEQSLQDADHQSIRGQAVTPFLLNRLYELTKGASLNANLALLRNNAQVASQIAVTLKSPQFS